jgi:ABC-type branched-subunit amino acid transport system substrate-binding protein
MRKRAPAKFLLLVFSLVLVGCQAGQEAGPIKIGFVYPFQGDNAVFGEWATQGIDLRLKEAGNSVAGRDIEVVTANEDPIDPSATLQSVRTLAERDGVEIIIGPAFSSSEEAVAPNAQETDLTHLILLTCPWEIAEFEHFVCWPGTDIATTRALGAYAYDVLGYRRVSTIGPDYVAGYNYINGAADEFKSKGGEVVQQQWVPLDATDMGPYVTGVDTDAEALFIWLLPGNEVAFIEQYSSQGDAVPPLLKLFDTNDPFTQQLGPSIVGTIGSNYWEPSTDNAKTDEFVEAFTTEYPNAGLPNIVQAGAYTMTDALLRVLESTGGDTSYAAVWPEFLGLEWDTVQGSACFTENGMALATQVITQLEVDDSGNYVWQVIEEYPRQSDPRDTGACSGS